MPNTEPKRKQVHVAVGVVHRDGHILLAKRAEHQHQGGLWEFPGGKVELGEGAEQALTRELNEELAIVPTRTAPLMEVCHDYSDKSVRLTVSLVLEFDGEPFGVEGQPTAWVPVATLTDYEFPEANRPIVERLLAYVW
ncbi:8-oxo-dGTP diphosphatase MutT [Halioxenophilus sp. WMMB6]|uniref:8-oxo-dGTP diphosphatase MutT n=1 Tax=Halioxenophilus sp. WMMB6 TaxID=3073815 RepID=UPI00295F039E|nr:8-oxo-dGTP diphosphatase MutT [Halioxenophilus sp. WMMB6]